MTDNHAKTKEAMLAAPRNAFYVWQDRALFVPRQLAKEVGRSDLTIVTPGYFGRKGRGQGMKVKIVIDPNCVLSVSTLCNIDLYRIKDE